MTGRRMARLNTSSSGAHEQPNVLLVKLSRNFGMEIAMSAGLDYAHGDLVVLMHADLQDPPELIPEMVGARAPGRGCRLCTTNRP